MKKNIDDDIRTNNHVINKLIKKAIATIKKTNKSSIYNKAGTLVINTDVKSILELELKKILHIYISEFPNLADDIDISRLNNAKVDAYECEELDAHGDQDGVHFASGTFNSLREIYKNLRYSMNENNVVKYNENGEEIKPLETDLVGTYKPHILNESELLENNLTLNDYFTYCSLNDAIDIDFFLDLLPHEAMHTFGFKGGIFEGITESFTRQIAQKYNLRFIPLAHPDETSLFQKVEKIIGRKNLSSCLYNPDKKGENIELLSDLVDDKTCDDSKSKDVFKQFSDSDENLFDAYKNKKSKNEIDKLANKRLECEEKLNDVLGKYISTYPNNLYTLGQALNISTYDESKYALLHKKEVVAIQEDEIEKLEAIINKLDRNEFRASLTTQNNSENEYDFAKADTHQDKSR